MLKGKMKKFFAAMMVTAMLCPSMVYADTLDAAPLDGELVLVEEDGQQFLAEQPSDEIVLDGEEGFDQEPVYEEEYDLEQAAFEADEEVSYSADEGSNEDYLTPDGASKTFVLGTKTISDPNAPNPPGQPWSGNYVYFGKFAPYTANQNLTISLKFRVLAKSTKDFNASDDNNTSTMFLDCDWGIKQRYYDNNMKPWET